MEHIYKDIHSGKTLERRMQAEVPIHSFGYDKKTKELTIKLYNNHHSNIHVQTNDEWNNKTVIHKRYVETAEFHKVIETEEGGYRSTELSITAFISKLQSGFTHGQSEEDENFTKNSGSKGTIILEGIHYKIFDIIDVHVDDRDEHHDIELLTVIFKVEKKTHDIIVTNSTSKGTKYLLEHHKNHSGEHNKENLYIATVDYYCKEGNAWLCMLVKMVMGIIELALNGIKGAIDEIIDSIIKALVGPALSNLVDLILGPIKTELDKLINLISGTNHKLKKVLQMIEGLVLMGLNLLLSWLFELAISVKSIKFKPTTQQKKDITASYSKHGQPSSLATATATSEIAGVTGALASSGSGSGGSGSGSDTEKGGKLKNPFKIKDFLEQLLYCLNICDSPNTIIDFVYTEFRCLFELFDVYYHLWLYLEFMLNQKINLPI